MGKKVDVPFTDEKVDPTDPVGSAKTIGFMILGFTILMFAMAFGQDFAGSLQQTVGNALGIDTGEGEAIEVV